MGSLSFSLQIVLISTGVLSIALLFKVSVPLVVDFSFYQAPVLWSSLSSWLKPPYLYLILNCIIITIAASSRIHRSHGDNSNNNNNQQQQQQQQEPEQIPAPKISAHETDHQFRYDVEIRSDYGGVAEEEEVVYEQRDVVIDSETVFEDKSTVVVNDSLEVVENKKDIRNVSFWSNN